MRRSIWQLATFAALALLLSARADAQQDGRVRDAMRAQREARREARRETQGAPDGEQPQRNDAVLAERMRVENRLRHALARAVRERLSLTEAQATRLMDVNRKLSDERGSLARDEMRIRRDLRASIGGRDSTGSPETARLLDALLDAQRRRLDLQQKEQSELSLFLTPEQRARYIAMMEQLRRRIHSRADSVR